MKTINGIQFAEMVQMGSHHLSQNAAYVDALNVFPVPDGDTGTNMNLSMTSGATESAKQQSEHLGKTAGALAKGLLMGARGNSGVILSQLFRGFGKSVEGYAELTAEQFAAGLQYGVDTAYKAVMKPVEGTILTVAKDAAKKAVEAAKEIDAIDELMKVILEEAKASLKRTPDLLPVLKEVGVVDSGGQGLVYVYEGFLASLTGQELPEKTSAAAMDDMVSAEHHMAIQGFMDTADIEFGFCTEFMVRLDDSKEPFVEETFRNDLSVYGDSLLVIADDEVAKIHIHSEQPGEVLSYGQKYGELIKIKIENMRVQHTDIVGEKPKAKKAATHPYAIVTVAMGEGVSELLKSLGASAVIEGGQTMNPSTEDIVKAIEAVGAERVLILPNNKNIIMAAEQAAELLDIQAAVVPTKTVPQGMAAILAFNPEASVEANQVSMTQAFAHVKTGQITFAVRDTSIDGVDISKDDYMAISEGKIILSTQDLDQASKDLLSSMIDEDSELITILYGEETTEDHAESLSDWLEETYPDLEVEVYNGKQPLYPYIISVE
ncbi:DAK2 domain-containing protein [Chryseomicrobium palamuruense]|uniref:DAK2 domain-containing protein n=1 Tax=Chryseomicrobium palamuruense TaxID=682973 RepID=A0ABV8UVD2_9BACL